VTQVKIYYHHTDAGGVVYYANYLKFIEEARTEFFAQRGISVKELADQGTLFVVTRQEADYKYPAFYADTLKISACISRMTPVRIEFEHEIINQDAKLICQAKTLMACVDATLTPKAIPEEIRERISK
jgi:acyl-CoA thioester hydrolase